jgi:hypothetical protein
MSTTNEGQIVELCRAVLVTEGDMRSGAIALLVAYLFNTVDEETMKASHKIAVMAGFDFSQGVDA